jgi:hypothetical protein
MSGLENLIDIELEFVVNLNKVGQTIMAVKYLKWRLHLELKEAKCFNDTIKDALQLLRTKER